MHKKDKIKALVALGLVVIAITSFLIVGKESVIMKYVSGGCLVTWLATMFFLNKKR